MSTHEADTATLTRRDRRAARKAKRRAGRAHGEASAAEKGYVIATTALLLVPLMIFSAFATDVGAWYVRAQQIQRATDAAALSGVVWMPNLAEAEHFAMESLKVNGYPNVVVVDQATFDLDGPVTQPQMLVSRVGDQQLRVDLKANGEVYFGGVVAGLQDGIGISRYSVAEYVLPVEFGSPTNFLGFGPLVLDGNPANAWTGMMGYCQPPHYGDVRAAYYFDSSGCQGNWNNQIAALPNTTDRPIPTNNSATPTNPFHDPEGYFFVVDVPQGRTFDTDLYIYDAPYCPTNTGNIKPGNDTRQTWLQYTLWDGTDTPLDDSDLVYVGEWEPGESTTDGCLEWLHPNISMPGSLNGATTEFTIPVDNVLGIDQNAGRWFIQVQNDEDRFEGFGDGVNYFSFEARERGTPQTTCFTYASATCVGIYARDQLPIRTQTTGDSATFFLANVEPVHAGKQLEVRMWDLGEGMDFVQILDPTDTPVQFTWRTDDPTPPPAVVPPSGSPNSEDCAGRPSAVALGLTGAQPCLQVWQGSVPPKGGTPADWPNHGRFNGRWATAVVDLPADPTDAIYTGADQWWKIRYVKTTSQNSADWTTWSTRVIGDPVRLVD